MKEIPLSQGYVALVDDEDYERFAGRKWHAAVKSSGAYAASYSFGRKRSYLHRLIMDAPPDMLVDHIDHNPLNCQRSNLRLCTKAENGRNRGVNRNNKTGYKGVFFENYTGRWNVKIKVNRRTINLGRYDTPEEAAAAYREGAKKYHLNFASW